MQNVTVKIRDLGAYINSSRTGQVSLFKILVLFFTGICLIITPSFIIGESNFPVPIGLQGEFFCRLVSSHYFLFTLGKISVALVMCLAIDRWFAIYRPLKYQTAFKRMKVFRNIAVIVVICCAMNSRAIFEKRPVVKQKVSKHKCECISFLWKLYVASVGMQHTIQLQSI